MIECLENEIVNTPCPTRMSSNIQANTVENTAEQLDDDETSDSSYYPSFESTESDDTDQVKPEYRYEWFVGLGSEKWVLGEDSCQVMPKEFFFDFKVEFIQYWSCLTTTVDC